MANDNIITDNISMTDNHSVNPIISQVELPDPNNPGVNILYDIHDDNAIHTVQDLGLTGYLKFKGAVASEDDLPKSDNEAGDIYHAVAEDQEYIWVVDDSPAVEGHWEEFGSKLMVEHTHDVSPTSVTADIPSLTVSGSATGTPQLTKSDIKIVATASGTAVGANGTATFVKSYPGIFSNLETTSVNSAGSNVTASNVSKESGKLVTTSLTGVAGTESVVNSVTPTRGTLSPVSIAGVSGSTTASKATEGTAVAVAKAGTAKSIPNVTGNTAVTASKISNLAQRTIPNVTENTPVEASKVKTAGSNGSEGSAASWSASVTNGVLSFSWTANTPTTPSTIPTFENVTATKTTLGTAISATYLTAEDVDATKTTLGTAISVTPAVSNGSITPYTFDDVTVPIAATAVSVAGLEEETSIVTEVSTGTTTVATANSSATTVATGSIASTGTGSSVITGVTATDVIAAGPATPVTVATGSLVEEEAEEAGASVMTGLGTATTGSGLTGVKVTTQPTITLTANASGVKTGETVSGKSTTFTVSGSTTASAITNGKTTATTTGQPK